MSIFLNMCQLKTLKLGNFKNFYTGNSEIKRIEGTIRGVIKIFSTGRANIKIYINFNIINI